MPWVTGMKIYFMPIKRLCKENYGFLEKNKEITMNILRNRCLNKIS